MFAPSASRLLPTLGLLLASVSPIATAATEPVRLLRVTPAGLDVPAEGQIVVQFDGAVVPLGRMERRASEVPVEVEPDPGCAWRWLDRSTLACQLSADRTLKPATRYRVELRPGAATSDGAPLRESAPHEFVTQRPAVEYHWFGTWQSPGRPQVHVVFNQPVVLSSLEGRIVFLPRGGSAVRASVESFQEMDHIVTLTPRAELPADSTVVLRIEPGVQSTAGPEAGIESRDVVVFRSFPQPRALGLSCFTLDGKSLLLTGAERPSPPRCDPDREIQLVFSSPVPTAELRKHLRITPDGGAEASTGDPWDDLSVYSQLEGLNERHEYAVPLPGPWRAFSTYQLRVNSGSLRDEFDRPLGAAIDLSFGTDHRRPQWRLSHTASVLEQGVETHLPVTATNVARLRARFDRVTSRGVERESERQIDLAAPQDITARHPLRVRDWLDGQSGAVLGSLVSPQKTDDGQRWFYSAVTPFGVHVKLGHFDSLVWVTDLASGATIEGAEVEIVEQSLMSLPSSDQALDSAKTDDEGVARLAGIERLDPDQRRVRHWLERKEPHLWVRVKRGEDLALFPLSPDFRVDGFGPGRSWVPRNHEPRHGHVRAWGTTAQGIYRAGDQVQYKIWVRDERDGRLAPATDRSWELRVIDPLDRLIHERGEIVLNDFGALDGEFVVPKTGAVGWYRFELRASFAPEQRWHPLSVLVSDFTPAAFRVATELSAARARAGDAIEATTRASLHAGGPYVAAHARVTATLRPLSFRAADAAWGRFAFAFEHVDQELLHRSEGTLDAEGEWVAEFAAHSEGVLFGSLEVESAVRDDRGRNVASRASLVYAARDRFVGVHFDGWLLRAGGPATWQALVTDELGQLVAGVPIEMIVERRVTHAARVRGAGNAYLTQYEHRFEPVERCAVVSGDGPVACPFTPTSAGGYRLTASIGDSASRPVSSSIERWAVGPGVVIWEEPAGHHLEIEAEQSVLRVGQIARYLVKNPFPGATALVTLERHGVLSHWLQRLDDSAALIEFPVEPDHLPGFFLSVVVASPRVERPPGEGGVDLGKPAFRIGYASSEVRDSYKELDVRVEPAAAVWRPGDKASVEIHVQTRQGEIVPTELAVAVVDEAVLDLLRQGAAAYDPYAGLYEFGGLDLWNFNLIKNLIGIQRFDKKGATPGGDGGLDPALRSRFRFVGYWNPSLRPDAAGRARVEFELPDNLTGWRVLAMAATPHDRLGLGQATFRVNRDTEVRPALPHHLIEGDRLEARFTVMNRTDKVRRLEVSASAEGAVRGRPSTSRRIDVAPFQREIVTLPIEATAAGEIRLRVRAGDTTDRDALAVTLPVLSARSIESVAQFGSTAGPGATETLVYPRDVRAGSGVLSLALSTTVLGGLTGLLESMRDYPYGCWEQRISRAVAAAQYTALRPWLPPQLDWPEASALPRLTLDAAADFQTPSGAMAYYQPRDEYADAYLSAHTALAFVWLRQLGHAPPAGVESRLHDYLLQLLRRDDSTEPRSPRLLASVRAVALHALAAAGRLEPGELTRWRTHLPEMDLFGRTHYWEALRGTPGSDALRTETLQSILAHAVESAGQFDFAERLDDDFKRVLHSQRRTTCAVLAALAAEEPAALAAAGAAELPWKIVRAVASAPEDARHWRSTQESLYCAQAMIAYAKRYEAAPPELRVEARIGREKLGQSTLAGRTSRAIEFTRPMRRGDAGKEVSLQIVREGEGRLYYTWRLTWDSSEPRQEPVLAGFEIRRRYQVQRATAWIDVDASTVLAPGDLLRVELQVEVPVGRYHVVVDDPLAGGLEAVQRELATASGVDAAAAEAGSDWVFYHRELRHEAVRFYAERVPPGTYTLRYAAQVIASGQFVAPPPRVEAMYEPDLFGQGRPSRLIVGATRP